MLYPLIAPVFFDLIIHGSCQLLKLIEFGLDIVKYLLTYNIYLLGLSITSKISLI